MAIQKSRFINFLLFLVVGSTAMNCSALPAVMTKAMVRAKNSVFLNVKIVKEAILLLGERETAKEFFAPKFITGSLLAIASVDLATRFFAKKDLDIYERQIIALEESIAEQEATAPKELKRLQDFDDKIMFEESDNIRLVANQQNKDLYLAELITNHELRKKEMADLQEKLTTKINQEKKQLDMLYEKYWAAQERYEEACCWLGPLSIGACWSCAAIIAVLASFRQKDLSQSALGYFADTLTSRIAAARKIF